jgi:hypothetical protein
MPEALALERNPVVVPAGQQLFLERRSIGYRRNVASWIEGSPRQRDLFIDIDDYAAAQSHLFAAGLDDVGAAPADPPKGGAKAGVRSRLRCVEPERPCEVRTVEAAPLKGKQSENPLAYGWKVERRAFAGQLKAAEKP